MGKGIKKKKALFIGGGYASCSAARILAEAGWEISIFEKSQTLGGMARTYYLKGMAYEFGPHILANHACSQKSIEFILKHIKVKSTTVESASFIEDKYLHYPPRYEDINLLKEKENILNELKKLPAWENKENFEEYLISKVGKTLYKIYYKDFTEKFWFTKAKNLDYTWAKLRHLGESLKEKNMFFNKHWCTYPVKDFNFLYKSLTRGLKVYFNKKIEKIDFKNGIIYDSKGVSFQGDVIISTAPIDKIFGEKYGNLEYSGYSISPVFINNDFFHPKNKDSGKRYGMVYYPEKEFDYTRTTEYKNFNNKLEKKEYKGRTVVTVETPSKNARFYPFSNEENEKRLKKYLTYASYYPKFVSLGRLGLYKYTTIDTTTEQNFRFLEKIKQWRAISSKERLDSYYYIRGLWYN